MAEKAAFIDAKKRHFNERMKFQKNSIIWFMSRTESAAQNGYTLKLAFIPKQEDLEIKKTIKTVVLTKPKGSPTLTVLPQEGMLSGVNLSGKGEAFLLQELKNLL